MRKGWGVRLVLYDLITMKNVISFLKFNCQRESRLLPNDQVLLIFEIIEILIDFEKDGHSEKLYRNYSEYEPIETILESDLSKLSINSIMLTTSHFLQHAEDLNARGSLYSVSRILFYFLDKLHTLNDSIVEEYWFEEIEDHLNSLKFGVQSTALTFTFKIQINEAFHDDLSFFKFLLEKDKRAPLSELLPIKKYLPYYQEKIYTDSSLRILVTNTKVRRLGYLKLLTSLTNKHKQLDKVTIYKKFESIASQYEKQLLFNKFTKGLIKITRTGNSAKPYIELAEDLGFLSYLNRIYSSGKFFKVYSRLQKEAIDISPKGTSHEHTKNIFELDKLDKLFFLEEILKNDFFYITSLIEIIFILNKTTESELRKVEKNERCFFQNFLLRKLEDLSNSLPQGERRKVQKIKIRVENWEKPKVYLEHVLMPRLNWLFDLGLIVLSEKSEINISKHGKTLIQHLSSWYDIAHGRIGSPSNFLNKFYIFMFDDVFYQTGGVMSSSLFENKVESYLADCFRYFQTLAPNRVTASQAITYIRYKFYLTDDVIVEHNEIEEYLRGEQKNYIFTFHRQYNDGYIQKAY